MPVRHPLLETCDQMLRQELPNLFRLFLNPYVVQTCLALERYVQRTWHTNEPGTERYQSFLANSFDEALAGAIKLARCHASAQAKSTDGLVIDHLDRLGPFISATSSGERVEFVPGLTMVGDRANQLPGQDIGLILLASPDLEETDRVRRLVDETAALVIMCVDRSGLARLRGRSIRTSDCLIPDIVVFDESFVNRDVPFGAFTAGSALFEVWNHASKSTFHSTTFQPNTISTLHFIQCLQQADPEMGAELASELRHVDIDLALRGVLFRQLYSRSLAGAISMTGCTTADVRASGHFISVNGRNVFDAVGGVACSVRGHNPPDYLVELERFSDTDCEAALAARLRDLTGLDHLTPAVSGASAVENALRLALVAQHPKRRVLALKAGFGGKTLLALTGTWNNTYKEHIDPLYPHVSYIDPFAPDAVPQIDAALAAGDVAVAQIELIQGVGGVRRIPTSVADHLAASRAKYGHLLLIDEVQTGMYRTGPFTLSSAMGITPDLLVIGKAISDMMFPFALTLYSSAVQNRLRRAGSNLPELISGRYGYPFGYKTALNALEFADKTQLRDRVTESGALFAKLLEKELASCRAVRAVRVFGLLIGIELDDSRWPQRWFKRRLFWFYLASMLRHPGFPVLVGFCQAEPNVLKITPPLTIDPAEIRAMCATIGETLRRPFSRLLASAAGGLIRSLPMWRPRHDRIDLQTHASAGR